MKVGEENEILEFKKSTAELGEELNSTTRFYNRKRKIHFKK